MNTATTLAYRTGLHTCWREGDDIFYFTLKLSDQQLVEIAVLTDLYFKGNIPATEHILTEACKLKFVRPYNCLPGVLRYRLKEDIFDMCQHMCLLRVVVMHNKPIKGNIKQTEPIQALLEKHLDSTHHWEPGTGFAFVVPHQQ